MDFLRPFIGINFLVFNIKNAYKGVVHLNNIKINNLNFNRKHIEYNVKEKIYGV